MKFPAHKASLTLEHNDHKSSYTPIADWVEKNDRFDWESDEHKARAIATNEVWTLQWYPDTPIGSYSIAAPTLEELLAFDNSPEERS